MATIDLTNEAPAGYLQDGSIAGDIIATRDDMISLFEQSVSGLKENLDYYNAEARPEAIGLTVPLEMRKLLAYVGYPRIYVDSIAERQEMQGFRVKMAAAAATAQATARPAAQPLAAPAGDPTSSATAGSDPAGQMWDWWQANDLDVYSTLGHTEALVHGRAYITISKPDPAIDLFWDPEVPIIQVESSDTLFAVTDNRTRRVQQAVRVIYDASGSTVVMVTLYLPNLTHGWIRVDGELVDYFDNPHNLGVVPVVPILNRTLLSDTTGTSQITPELRSATDAAARIMMDLQGAAETLAVPQRFIFGATPSEVGVDAQTRQKNFDAYFARILAFSSKEGKAGQFSAAELMNFVSALDAIDKKTAAYTGLPPQYLSFSSANPASAEAIKASEARLVKLVERKNVLFGGAWEQTMRIATAVMGGGMKSIDPSLYRLESVWADPSTPTYAAKADGASKLYANGTGPIPKEQARRDMGYSIEERLQMQEDDRLEAQALLGAYAPGQTPTGGNPISKADAQTAIGAHQAQAAADAANAAKPTETKTQSKPS
jgi:hypothetical protein